MFPVGTGTCTRPWSKMSMRTKMRDGYDIDRKRSYTGHFGGTSAAATNIAGAACALNGLARQLYGVPATPVGMRDSCRSSLTPLNCLTLQIPPGQESNPVGFLCNGLDGTPNRRLRLPQDVCACDQPNCETIVTIGWRPRIWQFGRDDSAVVQVATNLSGSIFEDDGQTSLLITSSRVKATATSSA